MESNSHNYLGFPWKVLFCSIWNDNGTSVSSDTNPTSVWDVDGLGKKGMKGKPHEDGLGKNDMDGEATC